MNTTMKVYYQLVLIQAYGVNKAEAIKGKTRYESDTMQIRQIYSNSRNSLHLIRQKRSLYCRAQSNKQLNTVIQQVSAIIPDKLEAC